MHVNEVSVDEREDKTGVLTRVRQGHVGQAFGRLQTRGAERCNFNVERLLCQALHAMQLIVKFCLDDVALRTGSLKKLTLR